jgi:2',3'-cyclic-nucleotide 2'-phosphodiesterase (5'-nucleotidase family)
MGGFARRMSYFNAFAGRYPARPFIRLDGGSLFSRGKAESAVVNRWMLEGTYLSRLDAVNLSAWDAPVWQEMAELSSAGQIQKEFLRIPLVSANARPKSPNYPVVRRYVIRECRVPSGNDRIFRVGITGLLFDPEERISRREYQIDDPEQSVKKVFEELKGAVDYRIVLTDMDIGSAVSLAVAVPGIDLILVAHNYDSLTEPEQVGSTLMVIPVNEGRMISEVRMSFDPKSENIDLQSRFVPLDQTVPDEPSMGALARRAEAAVDDLKGKK